MDNEQFLESLNMAGFFDIHMDTGRLGNYFQHPGVRGGMEEIGSARIGDSAIRVSLEWADDEKTPGIHLEKLSPTDETDKFKEYLPSDKEHKNPFFYDGSYEFHNIHSCRDFQKLAEFLVSATIDWHLLQQDRLEHMKDMIQADARLVRLLWLREHMFPGSHRHIGANFVASDESNFGVFRDKDDASELSPEIGMENLLIKINGKMEHCNLVYHTDSDKLKVELRAEDFAYLPNEKDYKWFCDAFESFHKELQEFSRSAVSEKLRKNGFDAALIDELVQDWGIDNLVAGYCIGTSDSDIDIPDAYLVTRIDALDTTMFENEFDALQQARRDGVPLIDDIPGIEKGRYLDTEENRKVCRKALERNPSLRIENIFEQFSPSYAKRYASCYGEPMRAQEKNDAALMLTEAGKAKVRESGLSPRDALPLLKPCLTGDGRIALRIGSEEPLMLEPRSDFAETRILDVKLEASSALEPDIRVAYQQGNRVGMTGLPFSQYGSRIASVEAAADMLAHGELCVPDLGTVPLIEDQSFLLQEIYRRSLSTPGGILAIGDRNCGNFLTDQQKKELAPEEYACAVSGMLKKELHANPDLKSVIHSVDVSEDNPFITVLPAFPSKFCHEAMDFKEMLLAADKAIQKVSEPENFGMTLEQALAKQGIAREDFLEQMDKGAGSGEVIRDGCIAGRAIRIETQKQRKEASKLLSGWMGKPGKKIAKELGQIKDRTEAKGR